MKRRKAGQGSASADGAEHLAPMETVVFDKLHQVVRHMAVTKYDDKEVRKPGWITIKTLGSSWVIQVKDPDSCLSMQVVADTLDNALALADLLLGSDEAPWEPDPFLSKMGGKKK